MGVALAGEQPQHRLVGTNEWRMHNHTTESASATAQISDVPTAGVVAQTVAALHDNNTYPETIAGFIFPGNVLLSCELGK
ncbi:hypothetical protein DVH05_000450 [Phytophthora capsici]|nr:hypothetical protein DVH05_000450 [Phytophthora capsici]